MTAAHLADLAETRLALNDAAHCLPKSELDLLEGGRRGVILRVLNCVMEQPCRRQFSPSVRSAGQCSSWKCAGCMALLPDQSFTTPGSACRCAFCRW